MLRAICLRFARQDMVELLLQRGRLADVQMLNFFNAQLEREIASTSTSSSNTTLAEEENRINKTQNKAMTDVQTTASVATDNVANEQVNITTRATNEENKNVEGFDKDTAMRAFLLRKEQVTKLAENEGPLSWLGDVYGTDTWSSSYLSHLTVTSSLLPSNHTKETVKQHSVDVNENETVSVTGVATVAGGLDSAPDSVKVISQLQSTLQNKTKDDNHDAKEQKEQQEQEDEGNNTVVTVKVNLDQPQVKMHSSNTTTDQKAVKDENISTTKIRAEHRGVMEVQFDHAVGQVLSKPSEAPTEIAARQNVLTAAAYSGILRKLQEVCALHATHSMAYDALLIRNKGIQRRLVELACYRFGVESLLSFVIGDERANLYIEEANKINSSNVDNIIKSKSEMDSCTSANGALEIPCSESILLSMYAQRVLAHGIDASWNIVRDANFSFANIGVGVHSQPKEIKNKLNDSTDALCDKYKIVPHRSKKSKRIDYGYINALITSSSAVLLTHVNGTLESQAYHLLSEILKTSQLIHTSSKKTSSSSSSVRSGLPLFSSLTHPMSNNASTSGSMFNTMNKSNNFSIDHVLSKFLGFSSGGTNIKLAAPHGNLRGFVKIIENDFHTLLTMITNNASNYKEPAFVITAGQYLAELFANLAVLYRSTASLNYDEDGRGHQEWLLAQAFSSLSASRRQMLLSQFELTKAAEAIKSLRVHPDDYSTHPVVLMNTISKTQKSSTSNNSVKASNHTTENGNSKYDESGSADQQSGTKETSSFTSTTKTASSSSTTKTSTETKS